MHTLGHMRHELYMVQLYRVVACCGCLPTEVHSICLCVCKLCFTGYRGFIIQEVALQDQMVSCLVRFRTLST